MIFRYVCVGMISLIMILVTPAVANELVSQNPVETDLNMNNGVNHFSNHLNLFKINKKHYYNNVHVSTKNVKTVPKTVPNTKKENSQSTKKISKQKIKNKIENKHINTVTSTKNTKLTSNTLSVNNKNQKNQKQKINSIILSNSEKNISTNEPTFIDTKPKTNDTAPLIGNATFQSNETSNNNTNDSILTKEQIIIDKVIISVGVVAIGLATATAISAVSTAINANAAIEEANSLETEMVWLKPSYKNNMGGFITQKASELAHERSKELTKMATGSAKTASRVSTLGTVAAVVVGVVAIAMVVLAILNLSGKFKW